MQRVQESSTLIFVGTTILLTVFTTIAYLDHFIIFGDSILSMSAGRPYPVPIWGHWIASRVVGDFFPSVTLNIYTVIAGAFGIHHIADIYSSFMALIYALNFVLLALAAFYYARFFVDLKARQFLSFALIFHLIYFSRVDPTNITLMFTYHLPFLIGIWFAYPFAAYVNAGSDPLARLGKGGALGLIALGAYFVAFSITNVYIFTTALVIFCAAALVARSDSRGSRFRALFESPAWFRVGILGLPMLSAVALLYDLASGRFSAEQSKTWTSVNMANFGIFDALRFLVPSAPAILFALLLMAFLVWAWLTLRRAVGERVSQRATRPLLSLLVIAATTLAYFSFLLLLTKFFDRNYFAYAGFPAPILFLISLLLVAPLFCYGSGKWLTPILFPIVIVVALASFKQLTSPPEARTNAYATQEQVRNLFSSMYMSYCFGSDRVPVHMKQPRYPYVPIPEQHATNWFGISFSRVFSKFVIMDRSVRYFPEYYAVDSAAAFLEELRNQQLVGTNRCDGLRRSAYYLDTKLPQ